MSKYNNDEVLKWKRLYEKFGNLNEVCKKYYKEFKKNVPPNTIKRRLKELIGSNFNTWYNKYKLMGKYSWDDAKSWKELYEKYHSYKAVEDYLKDNVSINAPHWGTISNYVNSYITKILGINYDVWLKQHERSRGERHKIYSEDDYHYWKKLYQELGSLKDIRDQLRSITDGNPPDAFTIRKGLQEILKGEYENWLSKNAKYPFPVDIVTYWKTLFEEYGSLKILSEMTSHDVKAIKKSLIKLLGKNFYQWYKRYSKYHERKWVIEDAILWKQIFEEVGNFNEVKNEIKHIYNENSPSASQIRKVVRRFIFESGENYDTWIREFTLSDIVVTVGKMIHKILEFLFMENFKDKGILSFYEISLNESYRVDNSIIITPEFLDLTKIRIPSNIRVINFDYTISSRLSTISRKFRKGYHDNDMILIIITLLSTIKTIMIPLDINYKYNIKIINIFEFLKNFNYETKIREFVMRTIKLANRAIYSPSSFEELRNLSNNFYTKLVIKFGSRAEQQKNFEIFF